MLTEIKLTDEQLLMLDGMMTPDIQAKIDEAKQRTLTKAQLDPSLTDAEADLISRAIQYARKNKKLGWYSERISQCGVCGKKAGYATHARSGRYHRKGEINYDKPLSMYAIDLVDGFVRVSNYVSIGGCQDCVIKLIPHIQKALADFHVELPKALDAPDRPLWKRFNCRRCNGCGWQGNEAEMFRSITLMADGAYPSTCPRCKAKNSPLGINTIETITDCYEVIQMPRKVERFFYGEWKPIDVFRSKSSSPLAWYSGKEGEYQDDFGDKYRITPIELRLSDRE